MYVCELFVARDGNSAIIRGGLGYLAGRPRGIRVISGERIDPDAKTCRIVVTQWQSLIGTEVGIEIRHASDGGLTVTIPWEYLWQWIRPTESEDAEPGTLVFPMHVPGCTEFERAVFSPEIAGVF